MQSTARPVGSARGTGIPCTTALRAGARGRCRGAVGPKRAGARWASDGERSGRSADGRVRPRQSTSATCARRAGRRLPFRPSCGSYLNHSIWRNVVNCKMRPWSRGANAAPLADRNGLKILDNSTIAPARRRTGAGTRSSPESRHLRGIRAQITYHLEWLRGYRLRNVDHRRHGAENSSS
jgi:hypothetical protein